MTEKLLSSGDTAAQGQHILTIRATEQCQVNLKMQPQQAAALKTGQEVIAEAAVLKKTFPGTITAIDNGTVTIMLENKLEELKAAMEDQHQPEKIKLPINNNNKTSAQKLNDSVLKVLLFIDSDINNALPPHHAPVCT